MKKPINNIVKADLEFYEILKLETNSKHCNKRNTQF